jgi:hypothetical protein
MLERGNATGGAATDTLVAQVEEHISTLMRAASAPGLSVAVIHGELLWRLELRTRDEMIRPHVAVNDAYGSSWALGWHVQKTGVINHGGDITGFHSMAVASPRTRSGVVIMTNGDNGVEILRKLIVGDTTLNRLITG